MNQHHRKLTIFVSFPSPILSNWIPSGDGLLAFEYISRIAKKGHNLHIICQSFDIKNFSLDNVKFYPVNPSGDPMMDVRGLKYMLKSRQLYLQLEQEFNFDIIHELNPGFTGLSLAFIGLNSPVILGPAPSMWPSDCDILYPENMPWSFHSLFLRLKSINRFFKDYFKDVFKFLQNLQASKLLMMSEGSKSGVGRIGSFDSKYRVITVGIKDQNVKKRIDEVNCESPVILFLAGIVVRKGIFTLLTAFEIVIKTFPDCKLVIAGDGPEFEQVKLHIENMDCKDKILLLGSVHPDKVFSVMNDCNLYCLPSYGEPFGITLLEAMACGKPIVTTDLGGPKYIVQDQGGRRVKPRDSSALAQSIIEILGSKDLQISMSEHNLNLIRTVYNWDKIIDRLEEVYFESLK